MAFAYGYNIGPKVLGIDFSVKHTTAQHTVGSIAYDNKGREWLYVKAGGTIPVHNFVKAAANDDPFTNVLVGDASAAATKVLGMTPLALSSGDFAWIVKRGIYEDDAELASGSVADGQPIVCDANGGGTVAAATDINNACGVCLIDDTDNTGTIYVDC